MRPKGTKAKAPDRAATVTVAELPDGTFVATAVAADGTMTSLATGTEAEVERFAREFVSSDATFAATWRERDRRLSRRPRHVAAAGHVAD
jgi:hypothetical protein